MIALPIDLICEQDADLMINQQASLPGSHTYARLSLGRRFRSFCAARCPSSTLCVPSTSISFIDCACNSGEKWRAKRENKSSPSSPSSSFTASAIVPATIRAVCICLIQSKRRCCSSNVVVVVVGAGAVSAVIGIAKHSIAPELSPLNFQSEYHLRTRQKSA